MITGCFLGIPLPAELVMKFSTMLDELRDIHAARYQKASTPHVTMLYFGDLREDNMPKIIERVEALTAAIKPFQLKSSALGYFGTDRHPRVAWIGTEASPALSDLHAQIDQIVGSFAARREDRVYQPHITIARVTSAKDMIACKSIFTEIVSQYDFSFVADRLTLYCASPETHERQVVVREFPFAGEI